MAASKFYGLLHHKNLHLRISRSSPCHVAVFYRVTFFFFCKKNVLNRNNTSSSLRFSYSTFSFVVFFFFWGNKQGEEVGGGTRLSAEKVFYAFCGRMKNALKAFDEM